RQHPAAGAVTIAGVAPERRIDPSGATGGAMHDIDRREFLKLTPVAAGVATGLGATPGARAVDTGAATPADRPRITQGTFTPAADYPIHAKPHFEVEVTDRFWKPKIDRNAAVTIPLEVRKLTELALSGVEGGRQLGGNVLEAAILSLRTHPDSALQAIVDRRIEALAGEEWRGNSGFEAASTYYAMTGRRDLLERAIRSAARIYDDFVANDPPFSGGERDAINCVQLYRATREKKH